MELSNTMYSILVATGIGTALALVAWVAMRSMASLTSPLHRRLEEFRKEDAGSGPAASSTLAKITAMWFRFVPEQSSGQREGLAQKLLQAGLRSPTAQGMFYAAKLFLGILLPLCVLFFIFIAPQFHASRFVTGFLMGITALVGALLPDIYLARRTETRKEILISGFPDALDLLVACTEAGLSFNAALERVSAQLPASHPELAAELAQVNAEIRAGVDRTVALRNLADRTALDDIRGLVALIIQSGRLGSGIAATLRIYAEEFRDKRMQRAEEAAALVGTKLIFPLIFNLWPAFFVVAVGPAVISIVHAFSQMNGPG